jgi:site-specific DNA-methyltransferase (adenine-specific)
MSATATPQDVLEGRAQWCVMEGEALSALRNLPSASVGALITDPPYSSGGFTRGDRTNDASAKYSQAEARPQATFGGDNRDQRGFEYWCTLWLAEAQRCALPGAPVVQFTDWRQLPLTTDSIQAGGWVWRGIFVWSKGVCCRPQMGRFRSACEYGVWGTNGSTEDRVDVGCLPGVIEVPPPMGENRVHLTQKPVEVMEAVCAIAPPGSVILDPFTGSGSTGIAAIRLGRRFIGIERDAHYAAIARDRIEAETKGLTLRDVRNGQRGLFEVAR